MKDIDWLADATLLKPDHVFCVGSLAQCLRRWLRLKEDERAGVVLKLSVPIAGERILVGDAISGLASSKEVRRL